MDLDPEKVKLTQHKGREHNFAQSIADLVEDSNTRLSVNETPASSRWLSNIVFSIVAEARSSEASNADRLMLNCTAAIVGSR